MSEKSILRISTHILHPQRKRRKTQIGKKKKKNASKKMKARIGKVSNKKCGRSEEREGCVRVRERGTEGGSEREGGGRVEGAGAQATQGGIAVVST